jgi:uncharacterized protein YggE
MWRRRKERRNHTGFGGDRWRRDDTGARIENRTGPETKETPMRHLKRRTLAALPFAALLALAAPALADPAPGTPTLAANGTGEVRVVPDIAIVTLGVTSRGSTASEALAANSTALAAAIDELKGAGIAEKDIGTSGLNVSPVYDTRPDREGAGTTPPPIVGYEVANTVTATIRDIASSGAILDKVVSAGANRISGISFDIADRQAAVDEALKAAIADARRKGALLADAAGVRLGRMMSITANENGGFQPVFARFDMRAAAAPPVPVMPGEQTVSASASIVWKVVED